MSLGLLVGRFGNYVRETYVPPVQTPPPAPFPESLGRLREATGHHLIPLVLIARADGEFAASEREVIVKHCVDLARAGGVQLDDADVKSFDEYVASYRPTLVQLEPAIHRLSHGTHDEVAGLIDAARTVVEADGVTRPEETKLLTELSAEMDRLAKGS